MILDALANAERYRSLHPGMSDAFDFLRIQNPESLPTGRIALNGDRVYAIVDVQEGRTRPHARLESHKKYIDIQYTVSGNEVIGWSALNTCRSAGLGYSEEKDLEFFSGEPSSWISVAPGCFAVFFPEDAHAPLAGQGTIHKVVIKVCVQR